MYINVPKVCLFVQTSVNINGNKIFVLMETLHHRGFMVSLNMICDSFSDMVAINCIVEGNMRIIMVGSSIVFWNCRWHVPTSYITHINFEPKVFILEVEADFQMRTSTSNVIHHIYVFINVYISSDYLFTGSNFTSLCACNKYRMSVDVRDSKQFYTTV